MHAVKIGLALAAALLMTSTHGGVPVPLLQSVRQYEAACHRLGFAFTGEKVRSYPDPAPGLTETSPPLITERIGYEGTGLRQGERFRIDFRNTEEKRARVELGTGSQIANYPVEGGTVLGVRHGGIVAAHLGCEVPIVNHFGTFWPGGDSPFPHDSLARTVQSAKSVSLVARSAEGDRYAFEGAGPGFYLVLGKRPGEVIEFGFVESRDGFKMIRRWRNDGFVSFEGGLVPTRLEHYSRADDHGATLFEDRFQWKLADLSTQVDEARLKPDWPKDLALSTFDGSKGGKVAVQDGTLVPVDLDYGSPAYFERIRQRELWIKGSVGAVLLAIAGTAFYLRRRRSLRVPHPPS